MPYERPDQAQDHGNLTERTRKLEVMPNGRTISAPKWAPNRDDLYAIAGHIYMLGCFGRPFAVGNSGPWAKVYSASQYLWATLDQRGFQGAGDAQQWTGFLSQMGALVYWSRYAVNNPSFTFEDRPMSGVEAAECRPTYGYGPWLRIGFVGASDPGGEPRFQARALWFHGLPPDTAWVWSPTVNFGDLAFLDESSYELWDGRVVNKGYLENPVRPVGAQSNFWVDASTDPDTLVPCGALPDQYNSRIHKGTPNGPFPTHIGSPCPGMRDTADASSPYPDILRYRLTLGMADAFLIAPPRIQSAALLSNDLRDAANLDGGEIMGDGPGLDWLATGVDALLGAYPAVAGFYASYVPIAYNASLRAHHYNWQQLQTSVAVRGRVEAQYRPDHVLLKGQLHLPTTKVDGELFQWPAEWAEPAGSQITANAYSVSNNAGGVVPITYASAGGLAETYRIFRLGGGLPGTLSGPLTLRLDGLVIPLRVDGSVG